MIQRIQSVYLFAAAIWTLLCALVGLGHLFIGLIVLLVVSSALAIYTIFKYNDRKKQIKLCNVNMLLLILWYATDGVLPYICELCTSSTRFSWDWFLPFASMVMLVMARRGVKADDKLIRDADRIR